MKRDPGLLDVVRTLLAIVGLAALGVASATDSLADSDPYARPEMAESADPDSLEAGTEDPDDLTTESRDPDDQLAESGDPDDRVVESRDPGSMRAESGDMDDRIGTSTNLNDLRESAGNGDRPGPSPELAPEVTPPGRNASAAVQAAWRQVESAERNLEATNETYNRMRDTNYPRGERRARIVAERNDAITEVNQARQRYTELAGN